MSTLHLVPEELRALYEVREWRNAAGVLATACEDEWRDIIEILSGFRLLRSEIEAAGGRKSPIANQIDGAFYQRDWQEKQFRTAITLDEETFESPTHKVDCFKGRVALELEWNNKDPFYDRDLNNFRLLYDLRVADVGVVVTRSTGLMQWLRQGYADFAKAAGTYGSSTTHFDKLEPRILGGGAGGCPVLVFAMTQAIYVDDREG